MADRHLELGLFAPTVGSMPPAGKPGAFLLSHAEQRTEPTFDYNLRLGEGGDLDDMLKSLVLGIGSSKLIGPPEKVAHDLARLHQAGVDAVGLTFRHTQEELADFIRRVVPLLEQHGVRRPHQAASAASARIAH